MRDVIERFNAEITEWKQEIEFQYEDLEYHKGRVVACNGRIEFLQTAIRNNEKAMELLKGE